jgi:hypothetical protein
LIEAYCSTLPEKEEPEQQPYEGYDHKNRYQEEEDGHYRTIGERYQERSPVAREDG